MASETDGGRPIIGRGQAAWWDARIVRAPYPGDALGDASGVCIYLDYVGGVDRQGLLLQPAAAEALRRALNDWHARSLTPGQALAE